MDTISPSKQDNWANSAYVVSTTRVLVALGLTFLIRSVYQLIQRMRSAGGNAGAPVGGAQGAIEVDLEVLALGTLGNAAMFGSQDGINETLEIALPQPTYSPQAGSPRHPASLRQQNH